MPTDLTQAELDELRQVLQDRRAQLQQEVSMALEQSEDQELQNIAGRVRDAGDESLASVIADLNLAHISHLSDEARAVEHALSQIDSGGYGICNACGQPIGYPRLKAQPTAVLCIDDQRNQERDSQAGCPPTL